MFNRWNKKILLPDDVLCKAIDEMERGLIDANLGGNTLKDKIYKKRIPLPGKGKSGGARTIVATSEGGRWFFLYGFEKSDRENITNDEWFELRGIAEGWLAAPDETLTEAISFGALEEICYEYS